MIIQADLHESGSTYQFLIVEWSVANMGCFLWRRICGASIGKSDKSGESLTRESDESSDSDPCNAEECDDSVPAKADESADLQPYDSCRGWMHKVDAAEGACSANDADACSQGCEPTVAGTAGNTNEYTQKIHD